MTEEQGNEIINLLQNISDFLERIDDKLPAKKHFNHKDTNDIYDKLDDVVSAINNVGRAIG